jgi:hypothetical protein
MTAGFYDDDDDDDDDRVRVQFILGSSSINSNSNIGLTMAACGLSPIVGAHTRRDRNGGGVLRRAHSWARARGRAESSRV